MALNAKHSFFVHSTFHNEIVQNQSFRLLSDNSDAKIVKYVIRYGNKTIKVSNTKDSNRIFDK